MSRSLPTASFVLACSLLWAPLGAQSMLDPALAVATVVSGLNQPIALAFLGPDDLLVTEKASGQVKRVTNGAVAGVVLDLAVNSAGDAYACSFDFLYHVDLASRHARRVAALGDPFNALTFVPAKRALSKYLQDLGDDLHRFLVVRG